jgi:phosphatidylglycerophosphate synthase
VGTSEPFSPTLFWSLGLLFCLLRIATTRIDAILDFQTVRQTEEEVFFIELPERVSDAVTLIGFGFAMGSSPWLGLATALAAIFSAYTRSLAVMRGAKPKEAASGPMTRIHRLILVSISSVLMLIEPIRERFNTPVPQIALWVILFGCLLTIAVRWFNIQEKVSKK